MSKRILSLMLCFVMVMSTLVVVPATVSAAVAANTVEITADKTTAQPGDEITYTVTLGAMDVTSLMIEVNVPEGLTYVSGSAINKSNMGWDDLSWTDANKPSLMVSGYGDICTVTEPLTIATFKCTVDDGAEGTLEIEVLDYDVFDGDEEEIEDCVVNNTAVTIEGGSGAPSGPAAGTVVLSADKATAATGDEITYTITLGAMDVTSLMIEVNVPEGLTYVSGSAINKSNMGWDDLSWTDANKPNLMVSGYGDICTVADSLTIATFTCTVDAGANGTLEIEVLDYDVFDGDEEEIEDCVVNNTAVTIEGGAVAPTTYTLTFVTDGSAVDPVTEVEGAVVALSTKVTEKAGYTFDGWYTEDTFTNKVTSVTLDGNKTVYARFLQNFTLKYFVDGVENETVNGVEGNVITLKAVPEKVGYTPLGWFVDNAGEAVEEVTLNSNIEVHAKFTVNKHDVIYMVDGVEYERVEDVAYGTAVELIAAPTREGYTFGGWDKEAFTMPDEDVTVNGTFTANKHDVIYMVDGVEYDRVEDVAYGTAVELIAAPTREGYTFGGWDKEAFTMPDEDVTVNGTFTANKHDVIYMVDGVEYERVEDVAYGIEVTLIAEPTRDGYTFSGWDKEAFIMPDEDVTVNGTFTLIPVVEPATVAVASLTGTFTVGDEVEVPVFIRDNPGFTSFVAQVNYDTDRLTLKAIEAGELTFSIRIVDGGNIALANATNVEGDGVIFTLVFEVKEGVTTGVANVSIVVSEAYSNVTVPVETTCLAGTVNVEGNGTGSGDETGGENEGTGGENEGTGGENEGTGGENEGTGGENEGTGGENEGTGGENEGTGGENEGPGGENDRPSVGGGGSVTKSYTVKFNSNGGTTLADKRVEIGGTLSEPTAPKRSGYKFEGWYTDKALTIPYNFGTEVKKNFTLYAKWTKVDGEEIDTPVTPDVPGTTGLKFTDVKANDWFYDSVKVAVEKGWFNGVSDKSFAPNLPVTRGMLVTVLHRAEGNPAVTAGTPFVDVDKAMYYGDAIAWAETNHIVEGVSETNFAPEQHITREQIAVIVYRYAMHKGLDVSVDETDISKYGDFSEISEYAVDAMKYAIANGIIKGKSATKLDPKAEATRAEVATIFQRIFEN